MRWSVEDLGCIQRPHSLWNRAHASGTSRSEGNLQANMNDERDSLPDTVPLKTDEEPISVEAPGSQIGPYKLLQQIGEGGMGTVYLAEQEEPVRRRVALKIIKAGMDSRQVIARFEAERQALSMMDHPNIAHVLDVGTTEMGRPYFVMELVKGLPITTYCDEKNLTPRPSPSRSRSSVRDTRIRRRTATIWRWPTCNSVSTRRPRSSTAARSRYARRLRGRTRPRIRSWAWRTC